MILLEKIYNSTVSFMKINIQVSPYLLNNFLDMLAYLDGPKVLKLPYEISIKYEKRVFYKITYENIHKFMIIFYIKVLKDISFID